MYKKQRRQEATEDCDTSNRRNIVLMDLSVTGCIYETNMVRFQRQRYDQ
jgi:hypothetical protein